MLEGALKISDVLKQFQDFIGDRILVAHNAPFDLGFIELALQRNNLPPISNQILCTVRLAHWLMPERDKFRLDDLAALYNVSIKDRHRSIGDAEATVEVLRGLLTHYATQNQASLNL
jgi:DNA polymerase-3 subunit alpha (Gram-positive type)